MVLIFGWNFHRLSLIYPEIVQCMYTVVEGEVEQCQIPTQTY